MDKDLFAKNLKAELNLLIVSIGTWRFWRTIITVIIGSLIFSVALNGILVPHNYFSGGVSGVSLVIYYFSGWPSIGIIYFFLNIPIFIFGWREISLNYIITSLIGVFIFTFSLEVTSGIVIPTHDNIMAAVLAGILTGFGTGIYLRVGGSAGGLDIVALIFKKRFSIPMGTTFIAINIIPITAAALLYNLDIALYTGIYMYVNSIVVEKVQTGFSQRKAVFIISGSADIIAEKVIKQIDRGVTFFHASGGWSHDEQKVIYTVINMKELGRLKQLLFDTDPNAFVAISNTAEVIGKSFLTWEDEGFNKHMPQKS
jgi:uncharacterized membrane-anchored protein YitT (DUF2179 family)